MHKLVLRQLKRTLAVASPEAIPPALRPFVEAVDEAYAAADADRALLERSLELTSEELGQRNAELARSNQELQRFAFVVSHDLQEPLRSITGYAQLIARRHPPEAGEATELLDGIVDSARRMHALIQGLLGYARVGQGGTRWEPLGVAEVVAMALANLKGAIDDSQADVHLGSLPTLNGDRSQLTQLFQNLVGNALKFRGEAPPRVKITAEPRAAEWLISVEDNGIGVPPEHAERIFQIFQRLHERSRYPGTGIGLAICDRIVKNHGGRIWAAAAPEGGTVFAFTIPVAPPRALLSL
jgi:light-regulated signal transduction histidine kinase (bacteriophytochrome)